jgi:acetyltransferase-like isoleucine patch superfamily enzyme
MTANPFARGYYETPELRDMGFACVGENVRIAKDATLIGLENIKLGSNIRIDGQAVIAVSSGYLELGNYIHIGGGCFVGCAGGVRMDDFSGLSQGVRIYSGSDDYNGDSLTNPTVPREFVRIKLAPVSLGRHVIIGSGSVILPGVKIGEGSSVGALSLVHKSLEPWGVYFGIPVKRLKARSKGLLQLEQRLRENEP